MIPKMTLMIMMMVVVLLESTSEDDEDGDEGGGDGDGVDGEGEGAGVGAGDGDGDGDLHDDLSGTPQSPSFPSNAFGLYLDMLSGIGPCNLLFDKSSEFNPCFSLGIGPVNWFFSK